MWTSLLPLAWSAMSPCRPELFSIVHCSGLAALPPRSSPRLFSNAVRYVSMSIARAPRPAASGAGQQPILAPCFRTHLLGPQRHERLMAQHVDAGEDPDRGDEDGGRDNA